MHTQHAQHPVPAPWCPALSVEQCRALSVEQCPALSVELAPR